MSRQTFLRSRRVSKDVEFTMTSWDPAGLEKFRAVGTQREVRMTLAPGQRWPDTMRRGQAVDFDFIFGDERRRFAGRVRFRRLNVAVLDGTLA